MSDRKTCSIAGCASPHFGHGWCNMHYMRWYRNGDPMKGADTRAGTGEPERFFNDVVVPFSGEECLLWPYNRAGDGYGRLRRGVKQERVARLSCESRNGPPPSPDHEAAHRCGNGHNGCCNPGHLYWATHKENMKDRDRHGRTAHGARIGSAKLTKADVLSIYALKGVKSQREVAEMFGVSQSQVSRIQIGKSWMRLISTD